MHAVESVLICVEISSHPHNAPPLAAITPRRQRSSFVSASLLMPTRIPTATVAANFSMRCKYLRLKMATTLDGESWIEQWIPERRVRVMMLEMHLEHEESSTF